MSLGAGLLAIARVLRWPILGGLIGAGAIAVGRYAGRDLLAPTARELGQEAGAGFAEGVVRFQQMQQAATSYLPSFSSGPIPSGLIPSGVVRGRWSRYT